MTEEIQKPKRKRRTIIERKAALQEALKALDVSERVEAFKIVSDLHESIRQASTHPGVGAHKKTLEAFLPQVQGIITALTPPK